MAGQLLDQRHFIALYWRTAVIFAALAAARVIYIELSAVPLGVNFMHLRIAAPALAIGAYYTFVHYRPLPATLLNGFGLASFAFTGNVAAAILTMYSGRHLPLMDGPLAAADRLIGFDWLAVLQLFERHPAVNAVLRVAYDSILPQIPLIVLMLACTRQPERLCRFMMATNLALAVTCMIAVLFPALGAYEFLGVSPADHPHIELATETKMTKVILWLRAAQFSDPAPLVEVGLISFPSFHAVAAAIYTWAMWRTPVWRWVWIVPNAMMLAATPVHGSHYLVDVVAGIAVAGIAIAMATWMLDLRTRPATHSWSWPARWTGKPIPSPQSSS